jgi:hypothetical protein
VKPREHVWIGGAVATALAPTLGAEVVAFWAATVLIDVDHYLDFLYYNRCRDLSIPRMFLFHRIVFQKTRRRDFLGLILFHTAEFFLGVYLLATWVDSSLLMAVLLGCVFHLALDVFYLAYHRIVFQRAYSIVEYLLRRAAMSRRGEDPDRPFLDALREMGAVERPPVPSPSAGPLVRQAP